MIVAGATDGAPSPAGLAGRRRECLTKASLAHILFGKPVPNPHRARGRLSGTCAVGGFRGVNDMSAQTHLFRCLQDNFGVLLHDPESGATAAIDAPEAAPVEAALKATGWRLSD